MLEFTSQIYSPGRSSRHVNILWQTCLPAVPHVYLNTAVHFNMLLSDQISLYVISQYVNTTIE